MKAELVNAWFLHSRPSGDTSLRVSLLTREYGIVEALYKGARTLRKKTHLQPFMPICVTLDKRREWFYVSQIESASPAISFTGQSLYAGFYVNELIQLLIKPQDAVPALYDNYFSTIKALAEHHSVRGQEPCLRRFERLLLNVAGFAVSFTCDEAGSPIRPEAYYQLMPGVGFAQRESGILGQYILNFSDDHLECLDTLKAAKVMMKQALAFALNGQKIRTRELYSIVSI